MDTTNLLKNIEKFKQHGDSIRIANIVNARRMEQGEEKLTPAYINYMLNGKRTMLSEVAEVATKYFEVQKQAQKQIQEELAV